MQLGTETGALAVLPADSQVRRPEDCSGELPFRGVEFFSRESMRYQSKFDPSALLRAAVEELDPDALKVLLLALCVGLRRGEIDRLLWRQVDFDRGLIRVEVTEAGALKTEDSTGAVQIDEELAALLRGFRAKARSEYVIDGGQAEGGSAPYGQRYRCLKVFARLTGWLRAKASPPAGRFTNCARKPVRSSRRNRAFTRRAVSCAMPILR